MPKSLTIKRKLSKRTKTKSKNKGYPTAPSDTLFGKNSHNCLLQTSSTVDLEIA